MVAADCETPGLGSWDVNCVTLAWESQGRISSVLLDTRRDPAHAATARTALSRASRIVLHSSPYDVPILWAAGLLDEAAVRRVVDTLILARIAQPDQFVPKNLSALATRHLGLPDFGEGLKLAFRAAGHTTLDAGYRNMDIDAPVYRLGAMADTVATLRLEGELRTSARRWLQDHPFAHFGARTDSEADEIIAVQETVNRVMLLRSARGIAVDRDYLDRYSERVAEERERDLTLLAQAGLPGGAGKASKLIAHLHEIGELPPDWPVTATGKLKATKDLLDGLEHPLAAAQRRLADSDKVIGYIEKVDRQARLTGRCHPQVGILGASQTGRWSVSSPELHQFSADARPILVSDGDGATQQLWSIDWSQIEPVTLGNMAGGTDPIISSYEAGQDLYEPMMRAAGIDRKTAKVVLLGSMYGMGVTKLARQIGHSTESAQQIRRQMFAAMPESARFISRVQHAAEVHHRIVTVGGRILPVDEGYGFKSLNHCIQGSAADQLCAAVVAIDDAGLGDTLLVGMHDELVVDCDAATAVEIERLMRQPHPNLKHWCGRDAVLRCDRQALGRSWAKV